MSTIEKRKKLLALSDRLGWKERRDKSNNQGGKQGGEDEEGNRKDENETKIHKNRINIKKIKLGDKLPSVEIRNKQMGENSQLYDFYPENRKFIIEWNVDHPFFKEMFGAQENSRVKDCVDFLIYAMAQSELKVVPGENDPDYESIQTALFNFKTELGTMLRVLMQ